MHCIGQHHALKGKIDNNSVQLTSPCRISCHRIKSLHPNCPHTVVCITFCVRCSFSHREGLDCNISNISPGKIGGWSRAIWKSKINPFWKSRAFQTHIDIGLFSYNLNKDNQKALTIGKWPTGNFWLDNAFCSAHRSPSLIIIIVMDGT